MEKKNKTLDTTSQVTMTHLPPKLKKREIKKKKSILWEIPSKCSPSLLCDSVSTMRRGRKRLRLCSVQVIRAEAPSLGDQPLHSHHPLADLAGEVHHQGSVNLVRIVPLLAPHLWDKEMADMTPCDMIPTLRQESATTTSAGQKQSFRSGVTSLFEAESLFTGPEPEMGYRFKTPSKLT